MQNNSRKQPRNDLNLIVEIKSRTGTENYHLGMTKNISIEGFTLESQNYNIKPGQVLEIDIKLPDSNQSVSAIGKSVWSKVTEFECLTGIEFMILDDKARNMIAQLISSAIPEPAVDMHHNHVPDSHSSKLDVTISEAVNTSSNTNVTVNHESSIAEDPYKTENGLTAPADGSIIQHSEITETKEKIPLRFGHDEISRKEPPPYSAPAAIKRSAAKVSARIKRSYSPSAVIAVISIVVIVSVFGVTKWKSKTHVPDSAHTAFNETEPEIINQDPVQLETPGSQDIEQEETTGDISGEGQFIIIASEDQDYEIIEEVIPQGHVPINDTGRQSPGPERDKAVIVPDEAPSEISDALIQKTSAMKKDTPPVKNSEALHTEIDSIPRNNTSGKISISERHRKQVNLKEIRQKIHQESQQIQKPSAATKRAVEKVPSQINETQGYVPATKVFQTPEPVTEATVLAKAGPSDNKSISRSDIIFGAESASRKKVTATAQGHEKESVSKSGSSDPAPPVSETIKNIPVRKITLPAAEDKRVPDSGSMSSNVSPLMFENNKTSEIISSSDASTMKSYDETFDRNTNNWDIFNTFSASAQIDNGAYILENKRTEGAHMFLHHHDFPATSDFLIETSIRLLKNSTKSSFGLIFGAKDSFNKNAFQITTNRHYRVRNYHEGISKDIIMEKDGASYFNKHNLNKLKIIRTGNIISFFINDQLVDKIIDLPFYGKRVGFIIAGRSKISVEHMHSEIQVAN